MRAKTQPQPDNVSSNPIIDKSQAAGNHFVSSAENFQDHNYPHPSSIAFIHEQDPAWRYQQFVTELSSYGHAPIGTMSLSGTVPQSSISSGHMPGSTCWGTSPLGAGSTDGGTQLGFGQQFAMGGGHISPSVTYATGILPDGTTMQFLPCPKCTIGFANRAALMEHMKTHDKTYSCDKCKAPFNTLPQMQKHRLTCGVAFNEGKAKVVTSNVDTEHKPFATNLKGRCQAVHVDTRSHGRHIGTARKSTGGNLSGRVFLATQAKKIYRRNYKNDY